MHVVKLTNKPVMAALCPGAVGPEEDEDEGSEYSYEYETDSEYEYEEDATIEVSECVMVIAPPPEVQAPAPPTLEEKERDIEIFKEPVQTDAEVNEEEFRKHREQLEKFKPKLPAYVTSPEPCAFSEDPSKWIGWMEEEVNKEKQRRTLEVAEAQDEEERQEREKKAEEERTQREREEDERLERESIEEESRVQREKQEEEERIKQEKREQEERLANEMQEAEEELEKTAAEEEQRLKELRDEENVVLKLKGDVLDEVDEHSDVETEWEYESESGDESKVRGDANAVTADSAECLENVNDITKNDSVKITSRADDENEGASDETSADRAVKEVNENDEINKDNLKDSGAKPQNLSQKATTHGQSAGGENPGSQGDNPKPLDGSLDPETQRKLDFVRKKRAEANRASTAVDDIQAQNAEVAQQNRRTDLDCLDEATRSKLEFIRKKKASAPSQGTMKEEGKAPGFLRQQSCPEKRTRPSSIASSNDGNLDDMLARIKTLRAERKQILHDMNAIKNAFDTPGESTDDGIDSAGDCTPVLEHQQPFQGHGPSPASLSRQGRRSIDSGIGSKSMCSAADGSPTAELESIHEGSERSSGKKKISHQDREDETSDGEFFCFICGENLGRLSKGAVMHMGLEDGEPVCPDALYLTDESKDKIKNIASTKMFTYEAKYGLLETVDLEIHDMDYGIPAEDVMDKVDAFLIDVERQKQLDKEKFEAMRSGAIDDILMEEFKDILDGNHSSPEDMDTDDTPAPRAKFVFSERTQALMEGRPPPPDPPPRATKQAVPPPPPPPPATADGDQAQPFLSSIPPPPPALSGVLNSIKSGQIPELRHTETNESLSDGLGQVIHRHIAPRAFTKDMRCLVKDLRDDQTKRLKKVKTVDKSKPFIPEDIEIYFYGGNNTDKKAPPPPLSKQPVNSSKKRGGKEGG